ncbi:hypothetical protein AVEN_219700-1 [Araneus ventricosus]|uniref:Uncharacterized protein n=1 Tax=Araneus ventricosus TaxID=182803 RepID=A0A4Y2UWZ0_ARAVE|nr:hypothetical protein AVEN_210191-1 [Araneus ventricosus]GBO17545.1 hypothetical protein AVEN_172266-1 [Araneus ventricosus]GBO17551.1 hypothetical protein AVEN_186944-1 [Araneus ventricosus]GBO17554.1 hypothetical protein AVEN_219700-1 [Araneus ventricosus]
MSLPKEYESVKVALENQPNVNLTLEFVTQRLIDTEALMNDSKFVDKFSIKYSSDNVTFAAKHKKLICNFCSKKGHTSKFCRLKASKCFSRGKDITSAIAPYPRQQQILVQGIQPMK